MTVRLGSNIRSLTAIRRLGEAADRVASASERLSSGQRINRASDDAAGLALASTLTANRRITDQGIRNLEDLTSLVSVAEGAMSALQEIFQRISELAEQASNGTFTDTQREVLDREAQALISEGQRITQTTTFNGISLLSADQTLRAQLGVGSQESLAISLPNLSSLLGSASQFTGSGTFQTAVTAVPSGAVEGGGVAIGDFNNDGKADFFLGLNSNGGGDTYSVALGNGDGSFQTALPVAFSGVSGFGVISTAADLDGDGKVDVIIGNSNTYRFMKGQGDGTFTASTSFTVAAGSSASDLRDINGDGRQDLVILRNDGQIQFLAGNGDGSFGSAVISSTGAAAGPNSLTMGDYNGDGIIDIAAGDDVNNRVVFLAGTGTGSFTLVSSFSVADAPPYGRLGTGDLNGDGRDDIIVSPNSNYIHLFTGNGNGTFSAAVSVASGLGAGFGDSSTRVFDLNGDGNDDLISVYTYFATTASAVRYGNGDGTFTAGTSVGGDVGGTYSAGDLNGDGVLDLVFSTRTLYPASNATSYIQNAQASSSVVSISLATQGSSLQAVDDISTAIERLTTMRGQLGASTSRLDVARSSLQQKSLVLAAAADRILNVDVAEEVAKLIAAQVRQQGASSVLAQANLSLQTVLKLLEV